jgi:ABC-2 type transport system permease protein
MLWISMLLFIFLGLMIGLLMLISKHPEIAGKSVVINTKASLIGKADWPTYLNLLIQMVLTIGSIGSGIVTIWVFGREYTDRVIKDLLALPVSRKVFVLSKFIIIVVWSILLLLLLFLTALIAGVLADLDSWSPALISNYFILYIVSAFLTVLLSSPVALITCLSRGYLLRIPDSHYDPVCLCSHTIYHNLFSMGYPCSVQWCSGIGYATSRNNKLFCINHHISCRLYWDCGVVALCRSEIKDNRGSG